MIVPTGPAGPADPPSTGRGRGLPPVKAGRTARDTRQERGPARGRVSTIWL